MGEATQNKSSFVPRPLFDTVTSAARVCLVFPSGEVQPTVSRGRLLRSRRRKAREDELVRICCGAVRNLCVHPHTPAHTSHSNATHALVCACACVCMCSTRLRVLAHVCRSLKIFDAVGVDNLPADPPVFIQARACPHSSKQTAHTSREIVLPTSRTPARAHTYEHTSQARLFRPCARTAVQCWPMSWRRYVRVRKGLQRCSAHHVATCRAALPRAMQCMGCVATGCGCNGLRLQRAAVATGYAGL